jgi:hypothetical protein
MSLEHGLESTQDRLAHAAFQFTNTTLNSAAQVLTTRRTPSVQVTVNSAQSSLSTAKKQLGDGVPVSDIQKELSNSSAANRSSDPQKFAQQTLGLALARASLEAKGELNQPAPQQHKRIQKAM